ncbi:MAG: hypothetical protein AB9872_11320 [Solidesulfovibrio sp.]
MDGKETQRIDRLEAMLRAAHSRRAVPASDPDLAMSVLSFIKAESEAPPANGILWRMAAGAGLLAAATVVFALTFGSGMEDEVGRFLFFDPNGQVLVSLLGV